MALCLHSNTLTHINNRTIQDPYIEEGIVPVCTLLHTNHQSFVSDHFVKNSSYDHMHELVQQKVSWSVCCKLLCIWAFDCQTFCCHTLNSEGLLDSVQKLATKLMDIGHSKIPSTLIPDSHSKWSSTILHEE